MTPAQDLRPNPFRPSFIDGRVTDEKVFHGELLQQFGFVRPAPFFIPAVVLVQRVREGRTESLGAWPGTSGLLRGVERHSRLGTRGKRPETRAQVPWPGSRGP